MSTIITYILIILGVILLGGCLIAFLAILLYRLNKKNSGEESKKDYDTEIKDLEARQKVLYLRLLALQKDKKEEVKEEEPVKVVVYKEVVKEPEPAEEVPAEEPAPVEEPVEAPVEEVPAEEPAPVEEAPVEEPVVAPVETKKMPSRRRSFALKLAASTETTKKYFSEVVNRLRLYGLTARIGKSKVMFRSNKEVYAKMIFKGKRIILCLPLNPKSDKFDPAVYNQLDLSEKKGFEDLAFGIKLTNKKVIELIFGLIEEVAKKFDFVENPKFKEIDYVEKYPDIYTDFEKKGYGYLVKTEVLRDEVAVYDDAFADKIIVEEKLEEVAPKRLIKAEISISDFNNRYTDVDVPVDMDRLKSSDLIAKNANYLVVKASSRIDKPFTVCAHEFEPDAVKMICIAGGKAVKLEYAENNEQ